jgi:hypothetical protein
VSLADVDGDPVSVDAVLVVPLEVVPIDPPAAFFAA